MISTCLEILERKIIEHIGPAAVSALADDVTRLSASFTEERDELPHEYLDDPRSLRAYLAGFLLTNAAKVLHCLEEAFETGLIPAGNFFRILDLGCGPGTASLAASLYLSSRFPSVRVEFTGVDRSGAALAEADRLFQRIGSVRHRFKGCAGKIDADRPSDGLFDIVIAANVLNEFRGRETPLKLCRGILGNRLLPGGLLVVIDPALKKTTRPLMELRDELASESAVPLSPCLHGRACPMLSANERDWCHFYLEWQRPRLIEQLDSLTGLDHRLIKMAYLILANKGEGNRERGAGIYRVVSSPIVSKGKRELVLCGSDGTLVRAMRQNKHASESNEGFELARRGDIVSMGASGKLLPGDSFDVVRRWQRPPQERGDKSRES